MKHLSTPRVTSIWVLFAFFFVSSCADTMMTRAPVDMPEGVLDAAQINELFSGNSVAANPKGDGPNIFFYFGSDGSLVSVREGFQERGSWWAREDGRLCIQLEVDKRRCPIIVKKGTQYRQYAVRKSGNHRYELKYSDFSRGNQLVKMSDEPVLPYGTLSRDKVITLFSGQTVESVTASSGRVSRTYYYPDGRIEQIRDGDKRFGKWWVRDDARICLQMEELQEKCRIIVKEDGEYRKYIVRKNSQHQHSVSYRNFNKGKIFW